MHLSCTVSSGGASATRVKRRLVSKGAGYPVKERAFAPSARVSIDARNHDQHSLPVHSLRAERRDAAALAFGQNQPGAALLLAPPRRSAACARVHCMQHALPHPVQPAGHERAC